MEGSLRRWGFVAGALALSGGGACAALMDIQEPTLVDEAGATPEAGGGSDAPTGGDDSGGPVGPSSCTQTPDSCPPKSFCTTENVCAFGCRTDGDCLEIVANGTAPKCAVDRHECVECITTPDCAGKPGTVCSPGGACVASCSGDSGSCDAGTCCNGFCVDTKTDVKNCDTCGKVCTGTSPHCCSGTCADTATSTANCGGCGIACGTQNANTTSCNAGFCSPTCKAGFAHCVTGNTGCETNTTNDTTHCGSCTTSCTTNVKFANGVSCQTSQCNYTTCQSYHEDVDNNRANGCETPCGNSGQDCCPSGPSCMTMCIGQNRCK